MKSLVVANWKMNPKTQKEAKKLFEFVKNGVKNLKKTEVVICPPFIWIPYLTALAFGSSTFAPPKGSYGGSAVAFGVGGQDCFWEDSGPFTGEISPQMLKDIGCKYVIIGHSERRINLGETDAIVNKKLKAALKSGLHPILCIGETKAQRRQDKTKKVLISQLKNALEGLNTKVYGLKLNIAYEPIWSISTMSSGHICKPKDAKETLVFIKEFLNKILGAKISKDISILYGGSVDSKNAKNYMQSGYDGLLVGGASLDAKEFVKIVKTLE